MLHRKYFNCRVRFTRINSNENSSSSQLNKCKADEQCGWERTDLYETYYSCSCPANHLCIRRNDTEYDVRMLFYSGSAYKTVCTKFENTVLNFDRN